jgi:hypothetical protein
MKNIYAFTGAGADYRSYVPYISVNSGGWPARNDQEEIRISVRSANAEKASEITLTKHQVLEMAMKMIAYVVQQDQLVSTQPATDLASAQHFAIKPDPQFMEPVSYFHLNASKVLMYVPTEVISYEDICRKAMKEVKHNPTVTWSRKDGASGSLTHRQHLKVEAGFEYHINCMITGNA